MRKIVKCWFNICDVFREDNIVRHKNLSPLVKEYIVYTALIAEKLIGNTL